MPIACAPAISAVILGENFRSRPAGDLPIARQIAGRVVRRPRRRRVDNARAAAVFDAQERPLLVGRDRFVGIPDRVTLVEQLKLVLGLVFEDFFHQLAKAGVEAVGPIVARAGGLAVAHVASAKMDPPRSR